MFNESNQKDETRLFEVGAHIWFDLWSIYAITHTWKENLMKTPVTSKVGADQSS